MAEKMLKTRVINKHETQEDWEKAVNFIPLLAEIVVYDTDSTHTQARLKIGDGNKPILVTSDDLKSRNPNYAHASATSTDEALAQGNHGISIVSLAPGQAIRLECEAILVFI